MTVTREARLDNIDRALKILMGGLGEDSIIMSFFRRPGPEYNDILSTTWDELEELWWIVTIGTTMGGGVRFQLTGSGWIEGLKRTGQFDPAVARLPQLCQAAKGRVKGREADDYCHVDALAADSQLPRSFVENVVESGLLERQFPGKKMELRWWNNGSVRQSVRIPRSFGIEGL